MTPPKDQAPGLVAAIKAINEWLEGEDRMPRTPDITALLHAYEQLEAENAELRVKVEKAEAKALTNAALWCRELAEGYRNSPAKVEALRAAEQEILRSRAALTEQANIRSPVQSEMSKMVDPRKDEK